MAVNGYFQLDNNEGKTFLKIYDPEGGGEKVTIEDVMQYLNLIKLHEYDLKELDQYIKKGKFGEPYLLMITETLAEQETCIVTILDNGLRAKVRFYPPAAGGGRMTEDDVIDHLKKAGLRHGVHRKVITDFVANPVYCTDYTIAEATPPVEGRDAVIEYFFDVNATAKPKLNEDGSVDFHQLGNIQTVDVGTELAKLTPADRGKKGISVKGVPLLPKKVKTRILRHGRNIHMSEDKCHLYADVPGHVTLVDNMVMLSDLYRVPANVDASTGDIVFSGSVEVAGNVNTGYRIEAEGDVIVQGVVEGAVIKSGGNIVIKRGVQGMDRGELEARGNVTVKFLENCKVVCEGELKADAVLHSDVDCKGTIEVCGKKGLINGGYVRTYASITATTLGSTMGSSTKVEVLGNKDLLLWQAELGNNISKTEKDIQKIVDTAEAIKKEIAEGGQVAEPQMAYIRNAAKTKPALAKNLAKMQLDKQAVDHLIDVNKNACIRIQRDVHTGVKVVVKDAMKIIHEHQCHCRFVRDGADVKTSGL